MYVGANPLCPGRRPDVGAGLRRAPAVAGIPGRTPIRCALPGLRPDCAAACLAGPSSPAALDPCRLD
ncbi:hypothetical protein G6F31_018656 [Rhizopus arrhizus]|nr:hypothetical protein G6F31_018656 [Rhizopus arrhizus]